jgi:acyl-CoA synthetase (AMP-forming)/AMP-acid ligase II
MNLGLPRDAVVATWLPNWIEGYLLRYACERAGLIWLPVPRAARPHELGPILATAHAHAVVLAEAAHRDTWAELAQAGAKVPSLQHVVVARGQRGDALRLEDLASTPVAATERAMLLQRAIQPDEVVMLQPTSGSTGLPKLCEYLLAGAAARGRAQTDLFHLGQPDVLVAAVSGFGPSITPLLAGPVAGAEVVVLDHPSPDQLLDAVARRRATVVCGAPPVYRDLAPLLRHQPARADSVRIWYSTGMGMPVDLAEDLERLTRGITLSGYGGVDLGVWTAPTPEDPPEVRWRTVGRARAGTELRLDEHHEVWGRGPSSTTGYFHDPEGTRRAWTADGWFRTGDTGLIDADGNLRIVGRLSDVINRGGHKVYPQEIEQLLEQHPSVARAALAPMPDERLGQRVCAYVVPVDGAALSLADVVDFLRQRSVASYKLPERLEVVAGLPLTSGGKLSRPELAEDLRAKLHTR